MTRCINCPFCKISDYKTYAEARCYKTSYKGRRLTSKGDGIVSVKKELGYKANKPCWCPLGKKEVYTWET